MADEKKSKMSRRSFLQKTAVGAAAVGAMTAAPTIMKMTENVQAGPPPGGPSNTPVMAYVKDASTGTVVVMWGTQEITTRDFALVSRLATYAR
jgi:phosphodiesterase/alkaline phosphatase D-like protein